MAHAADWLVNEIKEAAPDAWVIVDIPSRDMMFTKNREMHMKGGGKSDILTSRDPAKILNRHDELKPLIDMPNSLMSILSSYRNFFPRIYVSPDTRELLEKKKILSKMSEMKFTQAI